MLCAVVKGPTYAKAKEQIQHAVVHADLVELRLDYFNEFDDEQIDYLRKHFSIPIIFTLRPTCQGGVYQGSEEERLATLERLAALNPDFLDIEHTVPIAFVEKIQRKNPEVKCIISFHDFEKTPVELDKILENLQKFPAAFYKIATMAASSIDALRQLCFFCGKQKVISVSMGEAGQFSRVLTPLTGSYISYGCLDEEQMTASGQLPVAFLNDVYRYHSLNASTAIYGLIGDPVDKSPSHITHNAVMSHYGFNAVYVKIPVKTSELTQFFSFAKKIGVRGLSVTMPLKEQLFPFLDHVDDYAKDIGAVNTLVFEDGKLIGYNTDSRGALDAIEEQISVKGKKILMIGAGGAAKAIAYEAIRRGACLIIINRDRQKAQDLARQLQCEGDGLDAISKFKNYDILVNSTPHEMPIDPRWLIPGTYVMDIKTKPKETALLLHAKNRGCYPIYGYRMFIHQAVSQWNLWFKSQIDLNTVKLIIESKMKNALR